MADEKTEPDKVEMIPEDEVRVEEPKVDEVKPAQEPTINTPEKKSNTGKKVLIGCGIGCGAIFFIFVILIVLIFVIGGSQVKLKDYVNSSTEMYNATQKSLENVSTESITETKANFKKLETQSEDNISELEKTKTPSEAKQLKADLIEYYTITKKMSAGYISVYDLLDKIDRVATGFNGVTIDNSSFEAQASSLRALKKTLDPIVIEVDSMSVPSEVSTNHNTLKMYYKNFSTALDKAILGSDTKDSAVVTAAKVDMTTAMDGLQTAFTIDTLYKTEIERATTLEKDIQAQITELSK